MPAVKGQTRKAPTKSAATERSSARQTWTRAADDDLLRRLNALAPQGQRNPRALQQIAQAMGRSYQAIRNRQHVLRRGQQSVGTGVPTTPTAPQALSQPTSASIEAFTLPAANETSTPPAFSSATSEQEVSDSATLSSTLATLSTTPPTSPSPGSDEHQAHAGEITLSRICEALGGLAPHLPRSHHGWMPVNGPWHVSPAARAPSSSPSTQAVDHQAPSRQHKLPHIDEALGEFAPSRLRTHGEVTPVDGWLRNTLEPHYGHIRSLQGLDALAHVAAQAAHQR